MTAETCCIKGCDNSVLALGLCSKHWRRNRLYGSPLAMKSHSGSFRGLPAKERFDRYVNKTEGCWLWTGSKDQDGYGIFRGAVAGVTFARAHRFSYAYHTGELPQSGMCIMHSCDNPSCVNPDHLSLGTNADNMADKARKGRSRVPVGEKHGKAILTEEQAQQILLDARPYAAIAADYDVHPATISSIKNRQSWRHLDGVAAKAPRIGQRGEACYRAVLTDQDVRDIRASNERGKDLAERYGVSRATITDIRKGRSWKHLL